MPQRRRELTALALLVFALAVGLLGGCGQKTTPTPAATTSDTSVADLTQMSPAEKTSQLTPTFPVQVPVASGEVVRAEAQGDSAWVYQIVVPGQVAPVRNWYVWMYSNANWTVTAEGESEVTLQKGGAESRLQFEAVDSGDEARTKVTASLGVGTPVLQTQ